MERMYMEGGVINRPSVARFGPASLAVIFAFTPLAAAQVLPNGNPTSTFDTYGNVRPVYRDRRRVGLFANERQRNALRGFQNLGRRQNRRGGGTLFALPGDIVRPGLTRRPQAGRGFISPMFGVTPVYSRASERYSGFRRRAMDPHGGDISAILARQHTLIAATSFAAPVWRVVQSDRLGLNLRATVGRTPFVRSEDLEFTEEAPTIALDHRLREGIAKAHSRAQAEGWAWFREGQYRRAARAFESATGLEPKNVEDRIGELFCHVSMGATRTALAILGELNRRHLDLFRHSLPLARAFGDTAEAQQVRIRLRLQVNAAGNVPDLEALYALVLWFLGEREEAHLAVANIVRVYPHTAYAEWPSRMRAAQNTLPVEKDRP